VWGLRVASPSPNRNLKNTGFVHTMISNVLHSAKISHRNRLMTNTSEIKKKTIKNIGFLDEIKNQEDYTL
jgi:hypothetical protein